jgi:hypothetical protein
VAGSEKKMYLCRKIVRRDGSGISLYVSPDPYVDRHIIMIEDLRSIMTAGTV